MQNLLNTTAPVAPVADAVAPVATVKPARAKRAAKPAPAPVAPVATTPRAAALALHDKAGFTGRKYRGLSPTRNAGSRYVDLTTSKATARTDAQLSPRMRESLAELRAAFGNKPFPLCGIDAGQCAIFINSRIIVPAKAVSGKFDCIGISATLAPVKPVKPAKA